MLRPAGYTSLCSIVRASRRAFRPTVQASDVDTSSAMLPVFSLLKATVRSYADEAKWTNEALEEAVKKNKIVVFMKGTPLEPMCGFSKAVVTIFQMHGIVDFTAFNVLNDDDLRQKIKDFSNWPTVPQVYMNGEFVGGCDIMIQLHQSGELITELDKIGFRSVLAEEVD